MIRIGFWRGYHEENSELPWPGGYVNSEFWEDQLKEETIKYLDKFELINHQRGMSKCRICGILNGSAERSDGVYLWPEGYSHYVKEHGVVPPQELMEKINAS